MDGVASGTPDTLNMPPEGSLGRCQKCDGEVSLPLAHNGGSRPRRPWRAASRATPSILVNACVQVLLRFNDGTEHPMVARAKPRSWR